jgi:hypothetical protein
VTSLEEELAQLDPETERRLGIRWFAKHHEALLRRMACNYLRHGVCLKKIFNSIRTDRRTLIRPEMLVGLPPDGLAAAASYRNGQNRRIETILAFNGETLESDLRELGDTFSVLRLEPAASLSQMAGELEGRWMQERQVVNDRHSRFLKFLDSY